MQFEPSDNPAHLYRNINTKSEKSILLRTPQETNAKPTETEIENLKPPREFDELIQISGTGFSEVKYVVIHSSPETSVTKVLPSESL